LILCTCATLFEFIQYATLIEFIQYATLFEFIQYATLFEFIQYAILLKFIQCATLFKVSKCIPKCAAYQKNIKNKKKHPKKPRHYKPLHLIISLLA